MNCTICNSRPAAPRWVSSPQLCVQCQAEGRRLLNAERAPKPVKPFRFSPAEEARVRRETTEWLAWHKRQMFLPERPGCNHSARHGGGGHWHVFADLRCGIRSVGRLGDPARERWWYFCAGHAPKL